MVRKGRLVRKLVLISIAAVLVVSVILNIFSLINMRQIFDENYEEELHAAAVQLGNEVSNEYDGEWDVDADGVLTKGGNPVKEEYEVQFDELKSQTGIDYTLFIGKTRMVTTIYKEGTQEKADGTDASDGVVAAVLNGGGDYFNNDIDIQGKKYFVAYVPLKDDNGSIVGMAFAGREKSEITAHIVEKTVANSLISLICIIVVALLGVFLDRKISPVMHGISEDLKKLADGDLQVKADEKAVARTDEIGVIADATNTLAEKLREVIGTSKELATDVTSNGRELAGSAHQASDASGQVSTAVEEISKGAVSQAESIQSAATSTSDMGVDIDSITDRINELSDQAATMSEACVAAMEALEKLVVQNSEVVESMGSVGDQIKNTNDAVKDIAEASSIITAISEQTNLLSLNASIEAARAGEAGRGFAVVATEIGSLADQSKDAAVRISDIVKNLVAESEKTVAQLEHVNHEVEQQNIQIDSTKNDMDRMEAGVRSVMDGTSDITSRVTNLTSAKNNVVGVIDDLSAISEENAASTQQTNASMQELNATFEVINTSAHELQDLASKLDEQISYFKI